MYKKRYNDIFQIITKNNQSLHEFLKKIWPAMPYSEGQAYFRNVIKVWVKKVEKYIELENKYENFEIVKYEEMLKERPKSISIKNYKIELQMPYKSTKNDGKNIDDYSQYYLEKKYMKKIENKSIRYIEKYVTDSLTKHLGYNA
jgi:hypothetical protein